MLEDVLAGSLAETGQHRTIRRAFKTDQVVCEQGLKSSPASAGLFVASLNPTGAGKAAPHPIRKTRTGFSHQSCPPLRWPQLELVDLVSCSQRSFNRATF